MKKIVSMFLALVLVFQLGITAFAAEAHTINMASDDTEASVGDMVYVTVSSETAIESTGVQVFVYYDETALEFDAAQSTVGTAKDNFALGNPQTNTKGHYVDFSFINFLQAETVNAGSYYTMAFKTLKTGDTTVSVGAEVFDANLDQVSVVTADTVTFHVTEAPAATGYTVTASSDVTTTVEGNVAVNVNVSGHSNTEITGYNDYDVTMSYDTEKLIYESATAAHDNAVVTADETNGTLRITGHGDTKTFQDAVVTLNFTAIASGNANVEITSAKIDNKDSAISNDAPEAAISDEVTVVKVAYVVTLPDGFTGESFVLPGEDYTFTAPSEYYDVTVMVGDLDVTPVVNGTDYTINDVDGDVIVTATGMTFDVTFDEENTATIVGETTATHGTDYSFTVENSEGKKTASVTITKSDNSEIDYTVSSGSYVIAGADITADFTITVTETANATITFEGVEKEEVVGGLIQEIEDTTQDFQFQLNEEEGYSYTVKIGETELTPDENGVYTIPATMLTEEDLIVSITKTANNLVVEVSEYITLNEKMMYLITATMGNKVLAYGEEGTMFWSDKYDAYCWLVVTDETVDNMKTAAEAAIVEAAAGTEATTIAYDYDVNQTSAEDINDAQLTYDMYTGSYEDFTKVTMDKFLEADLNESKSVTVEDASAIVNYILGK